MHCLENGTFDQLMEPCKREELVCDSQHLEGLSTIYNVFAPYGQFVESSLHRFGIPIGSVVEINCASGFKRDFNWQTEFLSNRQNLTCLPNGTFDQVRVACIQDCGHPLVSIYPLTKGGIQTDPNKVPWHVSIYQRVEAEWVFICGGSIITPRLILSAAHCFWDNKLRRLFSQNQFQFVAGKYRRGFNDTEAGKTQIRNAQIIHVSERFEGPRNRSFADIAVIKLDLPLIYNENVSAICYKPAGGLTRYFVPSNITGIVTGYNELNNSLEQVTMTSAGYNECILHDSIGATLSQDKFCLYNGHDEGVCRGDSGSGFAQELKIYGESLFSLLGIISFSPGTVNGCAREGYIAVTNAKYMLDDLFDKFRKEIEEDLSLL
ncbi:modular serine protease-like [Musca domestica]|uniref:Modular serine protease-like n=1 Tax=Musca domestica TaxID=7370 RepID=A0ABM3VDK4_MUSDO|nr:modular serine protease-like [Musca domestica]